MAFGMSPMLVVCCFFLFFFNDTATTEIYTPSLHDALPILGRLLGALLDGEQLGPVLPQLIPSVLRGMQLARRCEGEPDGVTDARGETRAAQPGLVELGRVEPPHAGPLGQLGAAEGMCRSGVRRAGEGAGFWALPPRGGRSFTITSGPPSGVRLPARIA